MRICASTCAYWHEPMSRVLDLMRDGGWDEVDLLAFPNVHQYEPVEWKPERLLAAARRCGVQIVGLHLGWLTGETREVVQADVARIQLGIRMASEMGISIVVFNGRRGSERSLSLQRAGIQRIAAYLANFPSVSAGFENHMGMAETPEQMSEMLEGIRNPNVGFCPDTGHFHGARVDPVAAVRALGARIKQVHIKDHKGREPVAMGHGEVDNAAVVRALRQAGYGGSLVMELEVSDQEQTTRYLREGRAYMEHLLQA